MIVINYTSGNEYFTLNGKKYPQIYQAVEMGSTAIAIYGIHDIKNQLLGSTPVADIKVNEVYYNTQDELITVLIPILYQKGTGLNGVKGDKGDKGDAGLNGLDGADGTAGVDGTNGQTTYFHVAYADDVNGTGFSQSPTNKTYIGTYVDFTLADSSTPSDYTWVLIKGLDGNDGIAGTNGSNGETSYLHIAYATNSTGSQGFSTTDSVNKSYLGQYTDFTVADSTDPTLYKWTLIKGADGTNGLDGLDGADGAAGTNGVDGQTTYFHVAYADNSTGGGFSQSPTNKSYIGTYVDFVSADSTTPSDYTWVLIKGMDGSQGIAGTNGTNGQTSYLHIAYATSADGSAGFSTTVSANKTYIGQYTDFVSADSNNYTDYNWTLIKGADGVDGTNGINGTNGTNGVDGKKTATGFVYYQIAQSGTPPTPTSSAYNFGTGAFTSLTANWSTTPPTATGGGDYWYSKYTVTESTAGSNSGNPTLTAPAKHFAFTQLVTFTNLSTNGATTINGGNVTTGLLKSANYVSGTAPYSSAGSMIDLSNGLITSKNFGIKADGSAFFKGAVNGGTIDIGGSDTSSFHVDAAGNMWVGDATYANAPFKVASDGNVFLDDFVNINLGLNGKIIGQNITQGTSTIAFQEGWTDNTGSSNNRTAGYLSFDDTSTNSMYSNRIENVSGVYTYIQHQKAKGSYQWLAQGGTTHIMRFGHNGGGEFAVTGNITAYYSDDRLKTNLGNIPDALAKVKSLNGFNYVNNDTAKSFGYTETKQQVGVSAQQVKAVVPEAVSPAPFDIGEDGKSKSGDDYLTVDYAKLVPLLIESIKELSAEVEKLKSK